MSTTKTPKRAKRALLTGLATLATIGAVANPAMAASNSWSDHRQTNRPVIYQTNYDYESPILSYTSDPQVNTPSNSVIDRMYYRWKVLDSAPAGTELVVKLCAGDSGQAKCQRVNPSNSTATEGQAYTRFFDGMSGRTTFRFVYRVEASRTTTIQQIHNGGNGVQVNFNY